MTRAIQHHHYRVIPIINYSYFRPASRCIERDSHVIEKALLMAADHSTEMVKGIMNNAPKSLLSWNEI